MALCCNAEGLEIAVRDRPQTLDVKFTANDHSKEKYKGIYIYVLIIFKVT